MVDHVVILSEKSSGSSIFQRELLKHSQVNGVAWTAHTEHETLFWLKAANVLGYPSKAFWSGKPPFPAAYSRQSIQKLLARNLDCPPTYRDDWQWLKSGWEALIDRYGPVFVEKSPHHLNQWPALACLNRFVAESERSVKFLGLVRNPLSVVYSTQDRWSSELYGRQFMWENSYRNLLAMQAMYPPDQFCLVRYEDLIARPQDEFRKVLDFLGLDVESAVGSDVHSKSRQKWLDDETFSFRLHPVVAQTARRFGYRDDELDALKPGVRPPGAITGLPSRYLLSLRSRLDFYRNHVWR